MVDRVSMSAPQRSAPLDELRKEDDPFKRPDVCD